MTAQQFNSHVVRFSSDNQSIWYGNPESEFDLADPTIVHDGDSGVGAQSVVEIDPAEGDHAIDWNLYVPIIGGDRKHFEVKKAVLFEGAGKVTIDGERVTWDPEGHYDRMESGDVQPIVIELTLEDENGDRSHRLVEIEARGTAAGTGYVIPETGQIATGAFSFAAVDAADILQDAHHFDRVVPISIDIDAMDDAAPAIEAALRGLQSAVNAAENANSEARGKVLEARDEWTDAKTAAALVNDVVVKAGAYRAADAAYQGADALLDRVEALIDWVDQAEDDLRAEEIAHAAAERAFDLANGALSVARGAESAARTAVSSATSALNALIDRVEDALDMAPPFIQNAFNWVADFLGIDDDIAAARTAVNNAQAALARKVNELTQAESAFSSAEAALESAEVALNSAITEAAEATEAFTDALGGWTVGGLRSQVERLRELRDGAKDALDDAAQDMWDAGILEGRYPSASDLATYNAKVAEKLAALGLAEGEAALTQAALIAAQEALGLLEDGLDGTEFKLQAELAVEAFAQAGLQLDVVLDAGSVDSDIDYTVDATTTLDHDADTFTIQTVATNDTTGESVAFETVSPNLKFYAGIAYNIGATFDLLFDLYGSFAGVELFDIPGGADPFTFTDTVSAAGWIDLIDFDSTEFDGFDIEFPTWFGDIFSAEFNVPTVETQGREAEVDAAVYTDPTGINLKAMADAVLAIANAKLDYGPEFRDMLIEQGIADDLTESDLANALVDVLAVIKRYVMGDADTDGDGVVPIFQIGTADDNVDGLVHINSVADVIDQINIDEMGELGFFVGSGKSDNLFQVNVDVDQLIATAVNVALGNAPDTTINPMDLGWGLDDILNYAAVDPATRQVIEDYIKLDLNAQAMDLDMSVGANFSQKFALSVDDMDFHVVFEDGTEGRYKASEGGEIVIDNASELTDTDGNGQIDYTIKLTPDATFFNDTQVGLNLAYTLDLIKAKAAAAINVPLSKIADILPDVDLGLDFGFGPLLRLDGDLDLASADLFEKIFDYDAGYAVITGSFEPVEEGEQGVIRIGDNGRNTLVGTQYDDVLDGKGGRDKLVGKDGEDELLGGRGRDKLKAGKGDDVVDGGRGRDKIDGQKGDDDLYGREGADTFILKRGAGNDILHDFEVGEDVIRITRGASEMSDITFDQQGDDVVMSFANVETLVKNVTVEVLEVADNFIF